MLLLLGFLNALGNMLQLMAIDGLGVTSQAIAKLTTNCTPYLP